MAVAVSGGVDSVALLAAAREAGLDPLVLHVHHGTRPECDAEWELVQELAGERFRGLKLRLSGPDLQRRAREARYAWFEQQEVRTVLLAHHRDDQVETVLDRLCRGAGAGGLAGMPARRGRYQRPWLHRSRAEIEAFARSRGLRWLEDPSNRRGNRGRLRHEVLPLLRELRPGVDQAILRAAQTLGQDDALLQRLAAELVQGQGLPWPGLLQAPAPLARRALLQLARRQGVIDVQARHLDAVLSGARVVQLPGGWCFREEEGLLRLLPEPDGTAPRRCLPGEP